MTAVAGRIALVTGGPAEPESARAGDLQGLMERGWDVRLLSPGSDRRAWASAPRLAARTTLCRRRVPRLAACLALARAAARDRSGAAAALRDRSGAGSAWCKRQLAGHLAALRPRLVHFDSGRVAADWLAVTDALDCKVVVELTAEDLYGAGPEPFDRCFEVWTRAAALHFPDRAVEHRALQRGFPADVPRAVIPPLVDVGLFAPAGEGPGERPPPGKLRILSADSLEWMQGFEHAIHAVRLLGDAGVDSEYTIVGDGDYLAALTFARHQLGVGEQVHFPGPGSSHDLANRLRSADVFLSASVVDGVPWTVLQALASGTPVVMSDPGVLGDAGIDERAAFIVPRRSPEALAERLATLAGDERLRREMGRAGRDWAVENVSAAHRLAGLDGLFGRVLARPGSAH